MGRKRIPSFADYMTTERQRIQSRRLDLNTNHAADIVNANAPFELYPNPHPTSTKLPYAALLLHGLFDCPFTMREIGTALQQQGIASKALLLPGHGTVPADLLTVSYQDWATAVHYGVNILEQEAEKIILIGYSTGAA